MKEKRGRPKESILRHTNKYNHKCGGRVLTEDQIQENLKFIYERENQIKKRFEEDTKNGRWKKQKNKSVEKKI